MEDKINVDFYDKNTGRWLLGYKMTHQQLLFLQDRLIGELSKINCLDKEDIDIIITEAKGVKS